MRFALDSFTVARPIKLRINRHSWLAVTGGGSYENLPTALPGRTGHDDGAASRAVEQFRAVTSETM
jgi:hypothetical protein